MFLSKKDNKTFSESTTHIAILIAINVTIINIILIGCANGKYEGNNHSVESDDGIDDDDDLKLPDIQNVSEMKVNVDQHNDNTKMNYQTQKTVQYHDNTFVPTQITQVTVGEVKNKNLRSTRPPVQAEIDVYNKIVEIFNTAYRGDTKSMAHLGYIIENLNPKYISTVRLWRITNENIDKLLENGGELHDKLSVSTNQNLLHRQQLPPPPPNPTHLSNSQLINNKYSESTIDYDELRRRIARGQELNLAGIQSNNYQAANQQPYNLNHVW